MTTSQTNLHIINTGFYNSRFVYDQASHSPDRVVECYEFEYYPESGGVSFINDRPYPIVQGQVLVAAPGCIRCSTLPFKAYYVHFSTENPDLQSILNKLPPVSDLGDDSRMMEQLFKQIIQHFHYADPLNLVYAESKLLELIFRLSSQDMTVETKQAYSPIVLQAIEYIERNYKEEIKLEDIANAVGLTPVYLHKLLCKSTGQTPHRLLLEKRLTVAKELLAASDMSLVNVAAESGFSSQSYFNAVFKKYCGITPLNFRKDAFKKHRP